MSDLIDRQAAIDALKNDMASLDHIIKGMSANDVRLDAYVSQRNQVVYDIDAIEQLPPIQQKLLQPWEVLVAQAVLPQPAEPKRGKWIDGIIPNDSGGLPVIVCDQCNTFFPLQFGDGHNFCPNCGADMRGV